MNERELVEAFITRREYQHQIEKIYRRISELMSSQDDLTKLTDGLAQVETDLVASQAALQAELDQVAAANPGVDLSDALTLVGQLDTHVQAIGDLKPDVVPPELANPTTVVSAPGGEPTATGPQVPGAAPADGADSTTPGNDPSQQTPDPDATVDPAQAPVSDPQPADADLGVAPASSDPAQPGNNPENA